MENRITKLFKRKNKDILSVYFTAGYPSLNDTVDIIDYLSKAGVDIIEVGFPFSDPLADGPVIQESSKKAIENGMTLKVLFEQLKDIRKITEVPLVLMGYHNVVLQYGEQEFAEICSQIGIDGAIIPDMPIEYYNDRVKKYFLKSNLSKIFLITPQTSDKRAELIDKQSNGFLYMVSSDSVTGANKSISDRTSYFKRINDLNLQNPRLTGFGIYNKETFDSACKYSSGAIIGSAFIKNLAENSLSFENVQKFIKSIKP